MAYEQPHAPSGPPRPPLTSIVGFNVYILRARRIPRMTQHDLAEAAGVGVETVRRIERARDPSEPQIPPQVNTLEAIAHALGVDPVELVTYDPGAMRRYHRPDLRLVVSGGVPHVRHH